MPFKNIEDKRAYFREYMKRYRQSPHPSDTEIYDQPPILDDETIEAMKEGLTRRELDELNESIQSAMSEPDLDQFSEYDKLKSSALDRIKRGEAGLLFDVGGVECDPQTGEPLKKKSEDERLSHWGRFIGS